MKRMTAMAAALLAAVPVAGWPQPRDVQSVETITIRLSNFAFSPDHLRLRAGVPVRLHLENESGGGHNFSAPTLFAASNFPTGSPPTNGKIEVPSKTSADVVLIPRAPGVYEFKCSHFLHSLFGMTGTIVVAASQ
jgi:plastocyanin